MKHKRQKDDNNHINSHCSNKGIHTYFVICSQCVLNHSHPQFIPFHSWTMWLILSNWMFRTKHKDEKQISLAYLKMYFIDLLADLELLEIFVEGHVKAAHIQNHEQKMTAFWNQKYIPHVCANYVRSYGT